MRRAALPILLCLPLLLTLPGCFATASDVDRVSQRVADLERVNSSVMAGATAETKRLENLSATVEEATNQLRETLAKAGAKIEDSDHNLQKLRGDLEVIVHRLDALERTGASAQQSLTELRGRLNQLIADLRDRAGIAILALPADLPTDAEGFVKASDKALADGDVRLAAAMASECQKRYPATEAWGECGLVIGRIADQEQRYVDALKQFQAVYDGLGGKPSHAVAQSLVEVSKILEKQGHCSKAIQVWTYLGSEMPRLPQAKQVKTETAAIAKRCKEGTGIVDKTAAPDGAAPGEKKPAPGEKATTPEKAPAPDKPAAPAKPDDASKPAAPAKPASDLLDDAPATPAKAADATAKPADAPAKPTDAVVKPVTSAAAPKAPAAAKAAPAPAKNAKTAAKPAAKKPAAPAKAPATPAAPKPDAK